MHRMALYRLLGGHGGCFFRYVPHKGAWSGACLDAAQRIDGRSEKGCGKVVMTLPHLFLWSMYRSLSTQAESLDGDFQLLCLVEQFLG